MDVKQMGWVVGCRKNRRIRGRFPRSQDPEETAEGFQKDDLRAPGYITSHRCNHDAAVKTSADRRSILDPFISTGTSGVAAKNGCKFEDGTGSMQTCLDIARETLPDAGRLRASKMIHAILAYASENQRHLRQKKPIALNEPPDN